MTQAMQKQNASVFDIIGPIMVGPSSSHTAGALKISLLAYRLLNEEVKQAHFKLYGSFAHTFQGHGTDRALLAGIMGMNTDDLRIRDSFTHARARGLIFTFEADKETVSPHPNTVDIDLLTKSGKSLYVQGISIGGGQALITRINRVDVELSGNYDTLVVEHKDRPGALMHMTKVLSEAQINIAALKLYRESRGNRAFAIIEADEFIQDEVRSRIDDDERVIQTICIHRTEV